MRERWYSAALAVFLVVTIAGPLAGQQRTQMPAFEHDPDLDDTDQLAPSQVDRQMPAAVALPSGTSASPSKHDAGHTNTSAAEPAARRRAGAPYVVACNGVFAKDSSHQKLTLAFHTRNVAYTKVDDGPNGKMASVLYGRDPKRRLEVWWSDPISRSNTHLIVINGESGWIAPGGLALGLPLPDVEKLNGKVFKLVGFNKEAVAALSDWNGGALATLPGGCKLGLSLRADPHAAPAALAALSADREYTSSDSALRALNPTVSEILVGY
jgi:hypothetical protein